MRSLSTVGLALSVVLGCLLLALVAELYYLLWWKKRTGKEIEDDYSSPSREFLYFSCWKKTPKEEPSDTHVNEQQSVFHPHLNKDFWAQPFGEEGGGGETELMGPGNLSGPPRFLFTIKEETKEDLESEDAKSRGDRSGKGSRNSRSLSDMLLIVETPFLTPAASPSFFSPPLTPMGSPPNCLGSNPLFESTSDEEFNVIRSSPPSKFKFLKDAEDKLNKRKLREETEREYRKDEEDGSLITINISSKNEDREYHHHPHQNVQQYNSSSSQVLTSSPSTFRPPTNKKPPSSYWSSVY